MCSPMKAFIGNRSPEEVEIMKSRVSVCVSDGLSCSVLSVLVYKSGIHDAVGDKLLVIGCRWLVDCQAVGFEEWALTLD